MLLTWEDNSINNRNLFVGVRISSSRIRVYWYEGTHNNQLCWRENLLTILDSCFWIIDEKNRLVSDWESEEYEIVRQFMDGTLTNDSFTVYQADYVLGDEKIVM